MPSSEPEEYCRRKARLTQDANGGWAQIEQVHTVKNRASTALHQCTAPLAKADKGENDTHRQLPGGDLQNSQRKPRPSPLNLAVEDYVQQQHLSTKREHSGYSEFEAADQERRLARMGLGGRQYHGERAIPQTTLPLPIPEPTNHLSPQTCVSKRTFVPQMQKQPKAQNQQNERPAYGPWMRKSTNDMRLDARARQEARERRAQQKREEQKVQLPAAKPGNSYPGPSRIAGPVRTVDTDDIERGIMSDLALSVQLKSKLAGQEAYRKYKEEERKREEEQRKATLSMSIHEATRTESVKQLLTSVRKAQEQKVEAAELEAADPVSLESEVLRAQSQQRHQDPKDAYGATRRFRERFWSMYSTNYPMAKKSTATHCSPSFDPTSIQPLIASPGHSKGAGGSPRHSRTPQREVIFDSSRKSDYRSATEAIDKVSGDLLESPKTASTQDKSSVVEPWMASKSPSREECVANDASVPLVSHKDQSVNAPKQDVSPLPVSQARETHMSPEVRPDREITESAVEVAPHGSLDMQMEWEEIDYSLEDDGWSDVEQDIEDDARAGKPDSSDVEWASDVASEAPFDF